MSEKKKKSSKDLKKIKEKKKPAEEKKKPPTSSKRSHKSTKSSKSLSRPASAKRERSGSPIGSRDEREEFSEVGTDPHKESRSDLHHADPKNFGSHITPNFANQGQDMPMHIQDTPERNRLMAKTCVHHAQELKFYCDSCEEPICSECTIMGPHNTQLHRVTTILEAFESRFAMVNYNVSAGLLQKRDKLLAQIHRQDYRIEEIKSVKKIIEADIKAEYSGMIERLRSSEGMKLAILQHDISEIQKDIERIDEILNVIEDHTHGEMQPDLVGFLLRFRDINENIEYALTKPFKVMIDVYPHDLPRELAERRIMMEKMDQQKHLCKLKDEIIWQLIQEKKKMMNTTLVDLDKATQQEMNEWAKLTDKFVVELMKYQLVCVFCGAHLEQNTVNTPCIKNSEELKSSQMQEDIKLGQFSAENPPMEMVGNGRHFFGKPHVSYFQNPLKSPLYLQIQQLSTEDPLLMTTILKIKEAILQKQCNLEEEFRALDKLGNGEIWKEEVMELIRKYVYVDISALGRLLDLISAPPNKMINYKQFLSLLVEFSQEQMDKFPPLFSQMDRQPNSTPTGMNYGKQQKYSEKIFNPIASYDMQKNTTGMGPATTGGYGAGMYRENTNFTPTKTYYNEYEKHTKWMTKVAQLIREKGINISEILKSYDKNQNGIISVDDLRLGFYRLGLGINENDINTIIKFCTREGDRSVNIREFLNKFMKEY